MASTAQGHEAIPKHQTVDVLREDGIFPRTIEANSSSPQSNSDSEPLDLLLIGIGPSTLSIAIALWDAYTTALAQSTTTTARPRPPRILLLERNARFSWHGGMQLPGARMQISFLKDLATPRDPRSRFTFLNYLKEHGRLDAFTNLGTWLPSRREFQDYLAWCARWFEERGVVRYGVEVGRGGVQVSRDGEEDGKGIGRISTWRVHGRDRLTGEDHFWTAKRVVLAVGGAPRLPTCLRGVRNVVHSSEYAHTVARIQTAAISRSGTASRKQKFVVIGAGQSAAEIFDDLWDRFPEADVKLLIRGRCLRPSDDSPFVNEIFSPSLVSEIYALPSPDRHALLAQDRVTNYSVVRLSLLEHLYSKLYDQGLQAPDPSHWRCQILPGREVMDASWGDGEGISDSQDGLALRVVKARGCDIGANGTILGSGSSPSIQGPERSMRSEVMETATGTDKAYYGGDCSYTTTQSNTTEEIIHADYVFAATGYNRSTHRDILCALAPLLEHKARSIDPLPQEAIAVLRIGSHHSDETTKATPQGEMTPPFSDHGSDSGNTPLASETSSVGETRLGQCDRTVENDDDAGGHGADVFPTTLEPHVTRDYRLKLDPKRVDEEQAGIWLQGCNENTHGLSDTLLSIVAIRGGELVTSMFGEGLQALRPVSGNER